MKNSLIVFIFTLSFSITACSDNDGKPYGHTKVKIRLTNTSDFDYSDIYVSTSGGEFNYGDINSKETTGYHQFDWAFAYAYVELKIGDDVYKLQPIDYVGEEELKSGNYTYEIGARQDGGEYDKLTLNLVTD